MTVKFSREAGCWVYLCEYGCYDFDFESEAEATAALRAHECRKDS